MDIRKLDKKNTVESFIHISQLIIYTFACNILFASTLFMLGRTITWVTLIISFLFAIVLLVIFYGKKTNGNTIIIEIMCTLTFFVVFTYVVGKVYDTAWDGNAYHKLAIGLLKNGWNPLKELPSLEISEGKGTFSSGNTLWCESYCKATWFFGASVYAMTGNIECGKGYTILGILCAFFLLYYFLRKKGVSFLNSVIISICGSMNPVAIQQIWSFYIDGFLHTVLLILIISLLMLEDKEKFDKKISASLVMTSMIVCGNIKFTGLLYGGIFCIVYYLWACIKNIKCGNNWVNKCFKEGIFYFIMALITIFYAGSSSYLINYLRHGSFTYPLTGENKVDIMTSNSPFHEENHFKNLFLSLFSRKDNFTISSGLSPKLKIPFTVYWDSEKYFISTVDARISGFGILFGGIIIIALIIIMCFLVNSIKRKKVGIILVNIIVCLALMFGMKESWWARYSPYIYYIVLIALGIALLNNNKIVRWIGIAFATVVIVNNTLPLIDTGDVFKNSQYIYNEIIELKSNSVIDVCTTDFEGVYYNLKDKGVYYYVNRELVNENDVNIFPYQQLLWKKR